MASDVSMKIAERILKQCFAYDNTQIEANKGIIADFLDSMGVGDAFAACEAVLDGDNIPLCSDSCGCSFSKAREALRKAGVA